MPGQDRTGPTGQGPLTGRGLGPCGRGLAFRRGMGRGFGRGMGYRFAQQPYTQPAPLTKEEQKKILEEDLKAIEEEKQEMFDLFNKL